MVEADGRLTAREVTIVRLYVGVPANCPVVRPKVPESTDMCTALHKSQKDLSDVDNYLYSHAHVEWPLLDSGI